MLTETGILELLNQVKDPEIPVLSVVKMGIIKGVRVKDEVVEVDMVPTFAGCPAIEVMRKDIEKTCYAAGAKEVKVNVMFKQAWSTNEMTKEGKQELKDFGISPPPDYDGELTLETLAHAECPNCGSKNTQLQNSFGPTACRAIHFCKDCHETFEQMKPL
ncbi:1,2-phenylacetyl-CoA epoxidase subunit PaaD [Pontibacter sp. G13]|uniref:1,2-phenylacetyl-CoA epoxidase subunit PaaD n=1 Tax=Pontibacter sp. G13 TaxID=3074898 RepID=UPI002888FC0C|nr:1,2-phenylacetyl-CoA epoxidase subunit PaaD [Pontibacter sp. G13]WNJ20395.1 1,2-phenylacetyl-CoA epoxidase subunit PaaD [Pontibacter sp. G13]